MLEVRRLQALREVADAGSFSRAAAALGYTQSAISQQIATLERETGLQLVQRGTRPVALTVAGRALLSTAEPVFGQLAQADALVAELAGARARRLRLAAFPSACSTILPPAIAAVHREHPDTELTLVEAEPGDAVRLITTGEADLAIAYTYPGIDQPSNGFVEQTTLFDEPLLLVLPNDHDLLARRRLGLRQLAAERWLVPPADGPSSTYRLMLLTACREAGFEPQVAFEIEDLSAARALVAQGLGIALIPALALHPLADAVAARELAGGPPQRRIVTCRLPGPVQPATVAFQQALDEEIRARDVRAATAPRRRSRLRAG